jgi:hypothetical protein
LNNNRAFHRETTGSFKALEVYSLFFGTGNFKASIREAKVRIKE